MSRALTMHPIANPTQASLHNRRLRVGVLAAVVAQLAGMSQPELSMIESGRRPATPEQLRRLDSIIRHFEQAIDRIRRTA